MLLIIDTQDSENYGAHTWDGRGECPQHWKFKGGQSYKITGLTGTENLEDVVEAVRDQIEQDNPYYRSFILGYHVEADDYLSDFERSQLEYEGSIAYPEPTIEYQEPMAYYGA